MPKMFSLPSQLTICDATVRNTETVCDLLLDPPHLWPVFELVHFRQSRGITIDLLHKLGALVEESHQGIIHCMVKLPIWVGDTEPDL